jgi:hypothetical protein
MTLRHVAWALLPVILIGPAWSAGEREAAAQAAAESWLKTVDAGDYTSSWEQAAKLFKDAVTQEQWVRAAKGTRAPLGKLVSRRLKSRQYTEKLPGALDGKYVVIQFDTVFAP